MPATSGNGPPKGRWVDGAVTGGDEARAAELLREGAKGTPALSDEALKRIEHGVTKAIASGSGAGLPIWGKVLIGVAVVGGAVGIGAIFLTKQTKAHDDGAGPAIAQKNEPARDTQDANDRVRPDDRTQASIDQERRPITSAGTPSRTGGPTITQDANGRGRPDDRTPGSIDQERRPNLSDGTPSRTNVPSPTQDANGHGRPDDRMQGSVDEERRPAEPPHVTSRTEASSTAQDANGRGRPDDRTPASVDQERRPIVTSRTEDGARSNDSAPPPPERLAAASPSDRSTRQRGSTPETGSVTLEQPNPPVTASDLNRESELLQSAIVAVRDRHDAKGALALLDTYDREFPRGGHLHAEVLHVRVEALEALGQIDEALETIARARTARIGDDTAWLLTRGFLLSRSGRCAEAIEAFTAAHARSSSGMTPQDGEAIAGNALCFRALGRPELAEQSAREYVQSFPKGRFAPQMQQILDGD